MTTGRIQSRKSETASSTLPEIGKIKIGEKHPQKGYPMSLDYFRATGNFSNEFRNLFGDKPTKLAVCFISDSLAEVCNERFESWVGGKRWGWGDGEKFTVWDSEKKKYLDQVSKSDSIVKGLKWEMMLTLRFVLLEMKGILGYWTFQTKAKETTIPSIIQSFDFVLGRAGTIVGFPFSLIVEKKTGYSPGEPKTFPVVSLVPNFTEEAIHQVSNYIEAGGSVQKLSTAMILQQKVLMIENEKGGAQ